MAEVYLARTPLAQGLQKLLVIKKIHPAYAQAAQFRVMFRHEAEAAMNLNHPNIVQVFEWGELPAHYLAMEYVEGVDLMRLAAAAQHAGRRFTYGLAAYVVQQMAKGLDYAHRKADPATGEALGIVHRDISPQNILISYDGSVKLVDFGIAALRGAPEEEGVVKGKYAYMSPEQADGKPVDRRSDIFSAGVVLYELATGKPLFGHLKGDRALESIRLADVAPPRTIDPALPAELEQIILTALRRDPAQRYQTARDLHKALTRFFFDLASRDEAMFDSSALAAFCSQVIPTEVRRIAAPQQAAPAPPPSPSVVTAAPMAEVHDTEIRERKHVVVVEGELQGLGALRRTVGESRARDALLDFLRVAEHIAYKRGAHPDRLDEGGFSYIIGLPAAAEDDALRALELARDLKEALDGISRDLSPPLTVGIGLMRGVAEVTRRKGGFEHELQGPVAQVVRRLAREAMAGEILVGGGVYRMTRSEWHFDEIESIDVPPAETGEVTTGETRRAKVYRLRGPKERRERLDARPAVTDFTGGLIGREAELALLREAWKETVERNTARYVMILGETGVGKRSLVQAFLAGIPGLGATVLRAQARRAISDTPFALIADLVRDFLGIGEDTDPREVRRRIEGALTVLYPGHENDPEAKEIAGAVAHLLGVKLPGISDVDVDPTERRHRIFRAIDRLGDRLSRELPLVVVIEELHFADPQSLELLRGLVMLRRPLPLFGLATARPDERMMETVRDVPEDVQRTIQVDELPARIGETLLLGRFGNDPSVAPLIEQILAHAGGNPFYLRELVESLIERGVVAQAPDGKLRWVKREAEINIPTTVEAVIASRLDALPVPEKETLLLASVLGRRITPAELGALVGRDVTGDLEKLVGRALVDRESKGGYCFHNTVILEVAYAAIADEERKELHRRAAKLLAHRDIARPEADAVLARHADAAGEREEAVRRYLQAAKQARDVAGNKLAFDHLTRARQLLDENDHVRRFEIASEREQILRAWGNQAAALRELHVMRRAAESMNDTPRLAQAFARMARFDHEVGRAARARREAARALELAREAGDKLTEIEALRIEALILQGVGLAEEALGRIDEALALCQPGDRDPLLARASVMRARGTILMQVGNFRDAVDAFAEAMVIYRRLGVRRMEAATLGSLGMVSVGLGEYEEALGYYKRALAIDQEIGNRVALGAKLANIGQACLDLGDFERAERYLRKAIEIHEALSERSTSAGALITLGQVYLRRGEPEKARVELDRGLAIAVESSNRYQEIRALIYLALAHLLQPGGEAGGLELARSATRLAQAAHVPQGQAWGLAAEAQALAALGRTAEAVEQSQQAAHLLDSGPHFQDREQILHFHYRVLAKAKHPDAPAVLRKAWEEVQAKARRVRSRELRDRFLSSPPASEIVRDYNQSC